ncbi:sugar nucleotide-binding protein, partial [bacterium]|nr:sugar nucleotide-binding protein [bacterium]
MKIAILGASGLLGCSLIPSLRAAGYEVFCFSRKKINRLDIAVDYTDVISMENCLNKINPSFVINLAALTDVDECEINPNNAYLANVKVVESLCNWIK